ncbi:PIN domain-containing protein [Gordonibacter sp. Marseille-P4307]|uniref:PIN domain-containing protein n=1 Tax=Gordonibacter sp. Marseille-P4307 TaxID=2161815 RepID=UPI000F51BFB3|nr:type II toxin-antitoxin system VapC family toxin [Gordonibacter sp. Marseille-P4307]
MHTVIDESVILRYLLDDDKTESKQAFNIISTGEARTYPESIARVAITLRDVYHVPRTVIGTALLYLLEDVHINDQAIVEYSVRLFASTVLDYNDCLLLARNAVAGNPIVTFDKPILKRSFKI